MAEQFKWVSFYTEFASKLLEYKGNRGSLINKLQSVYSAIDMKMPKLEKDDVPKDIDPFTIFGLFNKGITDTNRITIIGGIKSEFGISAEVPDDFSGIPVLNNMMATFYAFEGDERRKDDDIENLWKAFEAAIRLAENDNAETRKFFSDRYDQVKSQFAVRWNLTMGLYWIRPYTFINLDSRNREFMSNPDNISANVVAEIKSLRSVPSAEQYLSIRDKCKAAIETNEYGYSSFPELSYKAWVVSVENSEMEKEAKSGKSNAAFLKWFKPVIQALRDLGGSATPEDTRKKIIENELLSEEVVNATRGKNNVNKFENEVAFARSYLVKAGFIDNKVYGIWTLTEKGKTVEMTDDLASDIFKAGIADNTTKSKEKNSLGDADVSTVHYWLYAPGEGAIKWEDFYAAGIMGLGWHDLGDLNTYASKEEMAQKLRDIHGGDSSYKNSAHAVWQFVHDMKPGDVVFAKKGRNEILGRGVIESDYEYDDSQDGDYPNIRKVKWTHKGSWQSDEMFAMKTLTDVTNYTDFTSRISGLFDDGIEDEEEDTKVVDYPAYTMEDFLDEVYMSEDDYNKLVGVLENKLNIILQGAPGVGKTFVAKRLAYSIMGVKDVGRVMMVQFHQSYSYEDFIMGIRPSTNGFDIKTGAFYNFCKKAEKDSDNKYFFIIDEINRGNLSKIFGELFMLIENDKRGNKNKLQLLYRDEMFYVPENVYIIGMMNTADRSLAMLDYALRRRFAFFDLKPGFTTEGFRAYRDGLDNKKFEALVQCVQSLNEKIASDESLGEGFCIGHSYFCNMEPEEVTDAKLQGIVEYELIPMLKEYWFDEPLKVKEWSDNLRSAVK